MPRKKKVEAKEKTSVEDIFDLNKEIASETDGSTLDLIEKVGYYIDTGNLAINYCCSGKFINGGIPGSRIVEVFGPESSGKSLLGGNILRGAQLAKCWCVFLDCENAASGEFMKNISGVDLSKVLRYTPLTLEESFHRIHVAVKTIRKKEESYAKAHKKDVSKIRRPIVVVFDSLSQPPCEREFKETDLPLEYSKEDWKKIVGSKQKPGERAAIISQEMRKLQSVITKEDVTCYFVNQTRSKVGVFYGNPETTPGGNAMKFYASVRLRTSQKKKIEEKNTKRYVGVNLQFKNIKNKVFKPFIVINDVRLYFEYGVDPLSGLLELLTQEERIIHKGAGHYEVNPEYAPEGKKQIKFRAKKSENYIDADILMACPKLVDANSPEEVEQYINRWRGGYDAYHSGRFEEKEISQNAEEAIDEIVGEF